MKRLILYVMMMGIAIAINSCEKETLEPDNLAKIISFENGIGRTVCFTVSLDKTRYAVGETVKATATASESVINSSYYYDGTVTMAGNGDEFFRYTGLFFNKCKLPSCECVSGSSDEYCFSNVLSTEIPVGTTPGIYSATLAVTRSGPFGIITKTKEVSIPYEVK